MRLIGFLLLASSSLLTTPAYAETRPHYGGTLHVAMREAPSSLDPTQSDLSTDRLVSLVFDSLVTLDLQGRLQPCLASAWQAEDGNQRWHLSLRRDIKFSDGTPLTGEVVAASLQAANPDWKVIPGEHAVVIERGSPDAKLPAELALPRNRIAKRDNAGKILGTGPFTVSQFDPGKKLMLSARDDYWGGRPFLDSVEFELGKSARDVKIAFDLGKTQLIEVPPEQARTAQGNGRQFVESRPIELILLAFTRDVQSVDDARQRDALSLSIDRQLLNNVVLQGTGEPAGGLLPAWLSGYSFLFPVGANLMRAQQERAEVAHAALWTLSYDPNDPLERVIAERVVLNTRDAGLRLQLASGTSADIRMEHVTLASLDPHVALEELSRALGLPQPQFPSPVIEDLYKAESTALQSRRVIPLLYLRSVRLVSDKAKGLDSAADGSWRLADVWMSPEKP